MIHTYEVNGLTVQTGDLICTTIGQAGFIAGELWLLLGKFVPGEVDHVAMYVGPVGRCVEAVPRGAITFELQDNLWLAETMQAQRGLVDRLVGVAYPLQDKLLSRVEERKIRENVAAYCLDQAAAHKPYNYNFFNTHTEEAFYCSHLVYRAYLPFGIDLNSGLGIPDIPGSQQIIFPQEIWSGCAHRRAVESYATPPLSNPRDRHVKAVATH
jgi:hypothetical protein